MRTIALSFAFLALTACGGSDSTPAAAVVDAATAVATAPVAAVADAAGGCKELDAYASAVEAYVAEFEKMNMMDPASAMALQQKAMTLQQQAMELQKNPLLMTPVCAPRWASIQARMTEAGNRAAAKADQLAGQADKMAAEAEAASGKMEAATACMEKCTQGDPMQMQACMTGCQK